MKFKLYAVFIDWGSSKEFLFMGQQDIVNCRDFSSKISRICHKSLVPKVTRHDYWKMFVKTSRRDRLACSADFVGRGMTLVSFFPANTTQLFSQSLPSHTLCSCLEIFPATNSICKFWRSKFQQLSTYAFCSWDNIFIQKWKCGSPNNLCRCIDLRPRCRPIPLLNGLSTSLEGTIL